MRGVLVDAFVKQGEEELEHDVEDVEDEQDEHQPEPAHLEVGDKDQRQQHKQVARQPLHEVRELALPELALLLGGDIGTGEALGPPTQVVDVREGDQGHQDGHRRGVEHEVRETPHGLTDAFCARDQHWQDVHQNTRRAQPGNYPDEGVWYATVRQPQLGQLCLVAHGVVDGVVQQQEELDQVEYCKDAADQPKQPQPLREAEEGNVPEYLQTEEPDCGDEDYAEVSHDEHGEQHLAEQRVCNPGGGHLVQHQEVHEGVEGQREVAQRPRHVAYFHQGPELESRETVMAGLLHLRAVFLQHVVQCEKAAVAPPPPLAQQVLHRLHRVHSGLAALQVHQLVLLILFGKDLQAKDSVLGQEEILLLDCGSGRVVALLGLEVLFQQLVRLVLVVVQTLPLVNGVGPRQHVDVPEEGLEVFVQHVGVQVLELLGPLHAEQIVESPTHNVRTPRVVVGLAVLHHQLHVAADPANRLSVIYYVVLQGVQRALLGHQAAVQDGAGPGLDPPAEAVEVPHVRVDLLGVSMLYQVEHLQVLLRNLPVPYADGGVIQTREIGVDLVNQTLQKLLDQLANLLLDLGSCRIFITLHLFVLLLDQLHQHWVTLYLPPLFRQCLWVQCQACLQLLQLKNSLEVLFEFWRLLLEVEVDPVLPPVGHVYLLDPVKHYYYHESILSILFQTLKGGLQRLPRLIVAGHAHKLTRLVIQLQSLRQLILLCQLILLHLSLSLLRPSTQWEFRTVVEVKLTVPGYQMKPFLISVEFDLDKVLSLNLLASFLLAFFHIIYVYMAVQLSFSTGCSTHYNFMERMKESCPAHITVKRNKKLDCWLLESKKHPGEGYLLSQDKMQHVVRECRQFDDCEANEYLGLIGLLQHKNQHYLLLIKEAAFVCRILSKPVYEVAKVEALILGSRKQFDEDLNYVQSYFQKGFYFGLGYELAHRYKNRLQSDNIFIFNYDLMKGLREGWSIPLVQGFVGQVNYLYAKATALIEYTLISRRSRIRNGMRFFSRGINCQGMVANFVETEALVVYESFVLSHVQIRGSVPLFWEQKGLKASLQMNTSLEVSRLAFEKHMAFLSKRYGRVAFVNLLSKKREEEDTLSNAFEVLVGKGSYLSFDLHAECNGKEYSKANGFVMRELAPRVEEEKHGFANCKGELLQQQTGVIRTNCMDCLDRTNLLQSKVGALALDYMMVNLGLKPLEDLLENGLLAETDKEARLTDQFMQSYKVLWSDNGDAISQHYTGTGSTHTDVTKFGKRTLKGFFQHKFTSVSRFYNQLFNDSRKQEIIRILSPENNEFNQPRTPELTLKVVTWNCSRAEPVSQLALLADKETLDLRVFLFQQVSDPKRIEAELCELLPEYELLSRFEYDRSFTILFSLRKHLWSFLDCRHNGLGGVLSSLKANKLLFQNKALILTSLRWMGRHIFLCNSNFKKKEEFLSLWDELQEYIIPNSEVDLLLVAGTINEPLGDIGPLLEKVAGKAQHELTDLAPLLAKHDLLQQNLESKGLQEMPLCFAPGGLFISESSSVYRDLGWFDRILYLSRPQLSGSYGTRPTKGQRRALVFHGNVRFR